MTKKITDLDPALPLTGAEVIPLVQNVVTRRSPLSAVADWVLKTYEGYDGGTVQDVLDSAKPMANYAALRAYTGRATSVRITTPGIAGVFTRDSDVVTADNGGTVIVDAGGRRWKRVFDGGVSVAGFGASNSIANNSPQIQAAIDTGRTAELVDGDYPATDTLIIDGKKLTGPGKIISSASTIARAFGGAVITRLSLLASGAGDGRIGVSLRGSAKMRDVVVDMTGATGTSGIHAIASEATSADYIDLQSVTAVAPKGYGLLLNETAPAQSLLMTHFNLSGQADAIEFNYPAVAGKNHVLWGGLLDILPGGTNTNSGFSIGIAHTQGFVAGGILSKGSRGEAVHIEDGCQYGVVSNAVLLGCKEEGFYGLKNGFGNKGAESLPILHGFAAYEYTGAGQHACIFNAWDSAGFTDGWVNSVGYGNGFAYGAQMEGHGVNIVDNWRFDNVQYAASVSGRPMHLGTINSKNATHLVRVTGSATHAIIDRVVQKGIAPTKIVELPSGAAAGPAVVIRTLGAEARCLGAVAAASSLTDLELVDLPRRFSGMLTVHVRFVSGEHAVGVINTTWNGSALTVNNQITDTNNNISVSTFVAASGKLYLRVNNLAGVNRTVSSCYFDFDGAWIE